MPTLRSFASLKRHRIDSRILVWFFGLAIGAFAFLQAASKVMAGDTLAFDRTIMRGLRSAADPDLPLGPVWLQRAMTDITALGGVTVLTLVTVLATGYLVARRKLGMAAFLAGSISLGATVNSVLKVIIARPRPDLVAHLVEVHSNSFPSAHAMNSAITYLTLGVLLARSEIGRAVRIYILSTAILLTLCIGVSRVYLGVHWPSDVIAGWCVGAAWAAICSVAARALQRRHRIEAPTMETSEAPPAPSKAERLAHDRPE